MIYLNEKYEYDVKIKLIFLMIPKFNANAFILEFLQKENCALYGDEKLISGMSHNMLYYLALGLINKTMGWEGHQELSFKTKGVKGLVA